MYFIFSLEHEISNSFKSEEELKTWFAAEFHSIDEQEPPALDSFVFVKGEERTYTPVYTTELV